MFHSIAAGLYDEAFEAYRTKQFNYILRYWGLHETALSFLEPLIQAAIHGDWAATNYQKGWLINERGVQMMFLGKSMDSELSFQESIKWYALTTDSELQSNGWMNISYVRAQMGDFLGALDAVRMSQLLAAETGTANDPEILRIYRKIPPHAG